MADPTAIPLTGWANVQLKATADLTKSNGFGNLSGEMLLGERAVLNGHAIPGRVSAGGGSRIFDAKDGFVALTLSRREDRELLPALFGDAKINVNDDQEIAARIAQINPAKIVAHGRNLGLAIASLGENHVNPASTWIVQRPQAPVASHLPLVLDFSALWAGPLAAHLLAVTGANVVKVESTIRPDRTRDSDPSLFAVLNQGKHNIAVNLDDPTDRDALITLIRKADIVIESARPRALLQLGIDANQLVRETPGLIWSTITGHGVNGDAANWIGFGDDCSVAGGLSTALLKATGTVGFVGDAIADPLTGIYAARKVLEQRQQGKSGRLVFSMSGVVVEALASEQKHNDIELDRIFKEWVAACNKPFPTMDLRPTGRVATLGENNENWLKTRPSC